MQIVPYPAIPRRVPALCAGPFITTTDLLTSLRRVLLVRYTPMHDAVARLDTSWRRWVLYLDPGSPLEDQCWAMRDVLRVLALGPVAARSAIPVPLLSGAEVPGAEVPGAEASQPAGTGFRSRTSRAGTGAPP